MAGSFYSIVVKLPVHTVKYGSGIVSLNSPSGSTLQWRFIVPVVAYYSWSAFGKVIVTIKVPRFLCPRCTVVHSPGHSHSGV